MKKILFVTNGEPDPSSRYRAHQYYIKMNEKHQGVLTYFSISPKNRKLIILQMFLRKTYSLYLCIFNDIIFLQRNPVKIFSPYYEYIIKKILNKKLIFDFDDNLWEIDGKYNDNINKIIKLSDIVIVGNTYLYNKAVSVNNNTHIINTVIDTKVHKINSIKKVNEAIVVIWSGSEPSNKYLLELEEVFIKLKLKYSERICFSFMSNTRPDFKKFNNFNFIKWELDKEIELLENGDIGIMPLKNDSFSKGKCGFKLILYGAYSIALIASPVEINKEIIRTGINGFLPNNQEEWFEAISRLIDDKIELLHFKNNSRKIIENKYSLDSQIKKFTSLLLN